MKQDQTDFGNRTMLQTYELNLKMKRKSLLTKKLFFLRLIDRTKKLVWTNQNNGKRSPND